MKTFWQDRSICTCNLREKNNLTREGVQVYETVKEQLSAVGGSTKHVAHMDALLFARHADVYARIFREQTGEKYTAIDFMQERYGLSVCSWSMGELNQAIHPKNQLKEDERRFRNDIRAFMNGTLTEKHIFVMQTPLALTLGEINPLPMEIDFSVLNKILQEKHANEIIPEILEKLPTRLSDPLLILRAIKPNGVEDSKKKIIVTDLKATNGATIMVPLILDVANGKFNKIASAYGRGAPIPNNQWYINRISNKHLSYINKKRTAHWLKNIAAAHNGRQVNSSFDLSTIVAGLEGIVKTEDDLASLKTTAPTLYQRAWHGSGHIFNKFKLSAIESGNGPMWHGWGLYFAQEKATAKVYKSTSKTHKYIEYKGKDIQWYHPRDLASENHKNVLCALDGAKNREDLQNKIDALIADRQRKIEETYTAFNDEKAYGNDHPTDRWNRMRLRMIENDLTVFRRSCGNRSGIQGRFEDCS